MKANSQKTVFINGASSGIGKTTAVYLAKRGFTVLASVRKQSDADMLSGLGIETLLPVCPLDMTRGDEIGSAAGLIEGMVSRGEVPPLHGLIFIAGGGSIAPVEIMDTNAFREELEKRLVGPVDMLGRLLPLLRKTRGRILWIATPGLFPVPYVSCIHAPDFAVNCLARTLNLELRPDGIKNILIRCGGIKTPAGERTETGIAGGRSNVSPERLAIYRDRLDRLGKELKVFAGKRTGPVKVAETVEKALLSVHPATRYRVGHMSGMGAFLEALPQGWTDSIMGLRER